MSAKIIDGKKLAKEIKHDLAKKVMQLKQRSIIPGLAVIIVGEDPASKIYVKRKKCDCEEIGIESFEYSLPEDTSEKDLIELIERLNVDSKVNGILVQLPLPKHIKEDKVICSINPGKDADCFHPMNVGRLSTGRPLFLPCTPAGIIELIRTTGIDISGKECVVVGRSNIVGKPTAMMLLALNGTVTVCHSKTKNLKEVCKRGDIVVAAIGKAEFINENYIKEGAIVIDVGMNRLDDRLVGDVEFESVSKVASFITPVPGGVGPMTRAILMKNTVLAAILQNESII
ncbi:MAG: bifunctional methylenetetrahydrofolate dehydrogenase/methenyltetrahydrofolate cyclohydrolase FolD [Clostridia bacterium]|jgi:methylenetetrahydrofolate dehydrogenase (NADP+)/methenyltetrahydrofolate cyclohydrolase